MKEICKNCTHCKPSYKHGVCELTKKKTKQSATCDNGSTKTGRCDK